MARGSKTRRPASRPASRQVKRSATRAVGSAKCDWSIVTALTQFQSGPKVGKATLAASSSKCDWSIRSPEISAAARGLRRTVDMQIPGSEFSVASAKCDWKMSAVRTAARFAVNSRIVSDKCDYRFQLGIDLAGKSIFRLSGAGSDKCDFHFKGDERINPADRAKKSR